MEDAVLAAGSGSPAAGRRRSDRHRRGGWRRRGPPPWCGWRRRSRAGSLRPGRCAALVLSSARKARPTTASVRAARSLGAHGGSSWVSARLGRETYRRPISPSTPNFTTSATTAHHERGAQTQLSASGGGPRPGARRRGARGSAPASGRRSASPRPPRGGRPAPR